MLAIVVAVVVVLIVVVVAWTCWGIWNVMESDLLGGKRAEVREERE